MSRGRFMVTCEHLGSCVSHSVEVLLLSVVVLFVVGGGGGGVCLLWGVETFCIFQVMCRPNPDC